MLKREFAVELIGLCPEIGHGKRELLHSVRLPFLRRLVCIGDEPSLGGAFEPWPEFLRTDVPALAPLVEAIEAEVAPVDRALVFFSSGSTAKPKAILHTHRTRHY